MNIKCQYGFTMGKHVDRLSDCHDLDMTDGKVVFNKPAVINVTYLIQSGAIAEKKVLF